MFNPLNLRHNASMRSSHCLLHISTTSTVEEKRKPQGKETKEGRRKKLQAYIKKCLILWIPLNWLRKSDGMSNEWTSPIATYNCTSAFVSPKRQRLPCWRLTTIHTFIAIITRLLWPKDSSLAHSNHWGAI